MERVVVGMKDAGGDNVRRWETRIDGDHGPCTACHDLEEGVVCIVVPYVRVYFSAYKPPGVANGVHHTEIGEWHIRQRT